MLGMTLSQSSVAPAGDSSAAHEAFRRDRFSAVPAFGLCIGYGMLFRERDALVPPVGGELRNESSQLKARFRKTRLKTARKAN
jgi:hypothetical protein